MVEASDRDPLPLLVDIEETSRLPGKLLGFGATNAFVILSALVNETSRDNLRDAIRGDLEWLETVGGKALLGSRGDALLEAIERSQLDDFLHERGLLQDPSIKELARRIEREDEDVVKQRFENALRTLTGKR